MKNFFKHLLLLLSLMAIPIYVSSINIRSPQVKLPPKNENISSLISIPMSIIQVPCKFGYIRSPKDNLCRETVPLVSCNYFQSCIFARN